MTDSGCDRVSDRGIGAFGIFAEDAEVAGQRTCCIDGLPVAEGVVERYVDVELVLPFASDDRQRLDLREVDVVEREDGQHLREASLRVAEREDERGLVRAGGIVELRGARFVGQDQEAGEVVLVGLDAASEDFETVHLRGVGPADGGRSREVFFGDFPGASGGVVAFDDFQGRAAFEELAALHQRNGVRMNFADFVECLPGERCDDVGDAEFLLADDAGAAALQEFVVGEQASGDGVLDGGDSQQFGIFGHAGEERIETRTGQHVEIPVGEIAPCSGFVVASGDALYGDSIHCQLFFKKNPALGFGAGFS